MSKPSFTSCIEGYLRAAYPLLWVQSHEETRVCSELASFYRSEENREIYEWDAIRGLGRRDKAQSALEIIKDSNNIKNLFEIIEKLSLKSGQRAIFLIKDFHPFLELPGIVRSIRNAVSTLKATSKMVVFVSPVLKVPPELEKEMQFVEFSLPDDAAIQKRLQFIKTSLERGKEAADSPWKLTPALENSIVAAAKGMSDSEVENAFALAAIRNKTFNAGYARDVFNEKIEKIKNNGLLNYIDTDLSFDQVGGLDGLKDWIRVRAKAYLPEARKYGLKFSKGVLLCGYPGGGKTLLAKATARELNVPLFQVDIGGLFGKFVGDTESNFRSLFRTVDAIGPCVLLIDEVEKALNRSATSGQSDSGASSRSFGSLLSWMSDKTSPVFIVATSNNYTILPPELIRKGRFDELFWLGLPSSEERSQILSVLLKRNNRDPKVFNLTQLAEESEGFIGSELEQVIHDAMFTCFARDGKDITTKDILRAIKDTEPQSKTSKVDFDRMAEQAKGKLRPAASLSSEDKIKASFRHIDTA